MLDSHGTLAKIQDNCKIKGQFVLLIKLFIFDPLVDPNLSKTLKIYDE